MSHPKSRLKRSKLPSSNAATTGSCQTKRTNLTNKLSDLRRDTVRIGETSLKVFSHNLHVSRGGPCVERGACCYKYFQVKRFRPKFVVYKKKRGKNETNGYKRMTMSLLYRLHLGVSLSSFN